MPELAEQCARSMAEILHRRSTGAPVFRSRASASGDVGGLSMDLAPLPLEGRDGPPVRFAGTPEVEHAVADAAAKAPKPLVVTKRPSAKMQKPPAVAQKPL
eukprot:8695266-Alexandrium_andersonii.AAC.1